jgi:hypothetical protein
MVRGMAPSAAGDARREGAERLARRHLEAENAGDVEAAIACFTPECRYAIPALGIELEGREAAAEHHRGMLAAFPDWRNERLEFYPAPDRAFVRMRVVRTHTGQWGPFAPTGRELVTTSLAEFPLAPDGLLGGEIVHLNPLDSFHQLGLIPSGDARELVLDYRRLRGEG